MPRDIVCLVHGCLHTRCGCPAKIAGASIHHTVSETSELPFLVRAQVGDPPPGPYRVEWRHQREDAGHTLHTIVSIISLPTGEELCDESEDEL